MGLNRRHIYKILTLLVSLAMVTTAVVLWRGVISHEWLASFGYKGIFVLSLINSVSPIAGPSQVATFLVSARLNPLLVGISGGVGGAIGELTAYGFGYFVRGSLSIESERKFERIKNWRFIQLSSERSFLPLFLLASIPNPFFDPVSAVAGSMRIALARYFIPVLLGRTLRHVVIAYAGFYSSSLLSQLDATGAMLTPFIGSLPFIFAVILIALVAWLVRFFAESDPDPLILNFTFFAAAGQCILTPELLQAIDPGWVLGLSLIALALVLFQVWTVRDHAVVTLERFKTVLRGNKTDDCTNADIDHWAAALVRIIGRDFSPQFSDQASTSGARGRRRQAALDVMPASLFKLGESGITSVSFNIPERSRRWRWWLYVAICVASWLLFLSCILIVRIHQ